MNKRKYIFVLPFVITLAFIILGFSVQDDRSQENQRFLGISEIIHQNSNQFDGIPGVHSMTTDGNFLESFEGVTFPPTGWTKISPDGGTGWNRQTAGTSPVPGWGGGVITTPPGGETATAFCTWTTGGGVSNNQWLITPQIMSVQSDDSLKFWLRYWPNSFRDSIEVLISTSTPTVGDFTTLVWRKNFAVGTLDTGWIKYGFRLGNHVSAGSNIYIAFREVVLDNFNDGASFSLDLVEVTSTPVAPSINPLIYPQYIQGLSPTNNGRIPYVYLAELTNLLPNSTYRYYNLVVTPGEGAAVNGAGVIMFTDSPNFRYTATGNYTNTDNYSEFTTDGAGTYKGWFITVPSGNARFTPGNYIQVQVLTNDGMGGTSVANRLRAADSVKVVNWGTTASAPNESSFFYGQSSNGTPKNFVVMYDNVAGTGRPITAGFIEGVGYDLNLQSAILPAYRTNVAAQSGRWGVLIPNALPNGIRRMEERALLNVIEAPGDLVQFITDASGNWNGIANTVNPNNGTDATLVYNGPLPVDLVSFNAATERNNVMLSWETAWEENNDRFEVQRKISANENSTWTTVGTVRGAGTTYQQQSYSFTDKNLTSGIYEYRLVQFDLNGNSASDHELSGTVSIGTPDRFELTQNYPNPFNPVTKIDFQLPLEGMITLRVFDMTGREVSTVMNEFRTAGYHSVQFDGSSLASGMYIYQLTAGSFTQTKKMLLVK